MIHRVAGAYRAAFSGLPREIWLLSGVGLVNRAGTMVLPFISLYLTQERGLTVTAAGRILGLYGLGAMLGSYLGGWATDRIGARRTLLLSLVGSGFGFLWLVALDEVAAIAVAVFVVSIVVEAFRPAVMAAIAQRAPALLQARAFALLRLAVNLGMGVGPAVGGLLALYSYRWLFFVDAATCWLAALLLVATITEIDTPAEQQAGGRAGKQGSPWRDGPFLHLMLLVVALAAVFFQVVSTLPLYYRQGYGFRESTIGILLALNAFLIVVLEMLLIHWAERQQRLFLVGLGSFLVCAGFALMPLGSSAAFAALTVVVWTFGEMLALPLTNALVADRADAGNRGRYMGAYTMAFSVAFVFAPAAGTWVYDRFGPETLWFGIGTIGPLLWLWSVALIRSFRPRWPSGVEKPERPKYLD